MHDAETLKRRPQARKVAVSAMLLALAYVLPFFTGQLRTLGNMLCPMHIPVMLCGFLCGGGWGMAVGFAAPLLRSVTLGMPVIFPSGICMALELAVYGLVSGLAYRRLPEKRGCIYAALLLAMLAGRLVWGAARFLCTGLDVTQFGLQTFWTGGFVTAAPGMVLQLAVIPPIVMALKRRQTALNNPKKEEERV